MTIGAGAGAGTVVGWITQHHWFGDGYDPQNPTVTGSVSAGFALEFTCAV